MSEAELKAKGFEQLVSLTEQNKMLGSQLQQMMGAIQKIAEAAGVEISEGSSLESAVDGILKKLASKAKK